MFVLAVMTAGCSTSSTQGIHAPELLEQRPERQDWLGAEPGRRAQAIRGCATVGGGDAKRRLVSVIPFDQETGAPVYTGRLSGYRSVGLGGAVGEARDAAR